MPPTWTSRPPRKGRRPGPRAVRLLAPALALCIGLVFGMPAARAGGTYSVPNGTQGKFAGADIENLWPDGVVETAAAFQRMASDGLNTASLYVWWEADSPHANTVHPYSATISDTDLATEISLARSAGLRVSLTPIFYCNGCDGNFRGVIYPASLQAFFASYTAFIDHYAALAQADGVSTFWVGSEMNSLEAGTNEWTRLIRSVRGIFHGGLAYEENWNVLGNAHWLNLVDLIGVSAYFPLDDAAEPNLAQLLRDWRSSGDAQWRGRDWVAAVDRLVTTFHKPILFGEIGYMSSDYAAAHPWLAYYDKPNLELQENLYQAVLQTFSRYGWWAGAVWWDYSSAPDGTMNGRTFVGKLAEVLLEEWYRQGTRPSDPNSPLV